MTTGGTLDLQAAADELGVHYQTAYRWVRAGRLPAHRVDGRYVITRDDLAVFVVERSSPATPPVPSQRRLDTASKTMHSALVDGDEGTARNLARSIIDQGTPLPELIQKVIVPPLQQIGVDWHDGHLSIWVEHRASAIIDRLLGDITPNPRGRRRGTAMVAAVAGDRHSLATSMAAVTLRDNNWEVHHLGADVPADEIVAFCESTRLDIAVITLTNPDSTASAHATADRLRKLGVQTIVGAPGTTLDDLLDAASAALADSRTSASAN